MNILSETYIFYADIYFIQNFIIKIAVVYLSLFCNKKHGVIYSVNGIVKIILVAFGGTIFEMIGLIFGGSYNMFIVAVHLLEVPLMFWAVLGKQLRERFRIIITGYFFIVVINGVLEVLWNWFGENASFVLLLLFSCGAVVVGVCIWKNYSKMQKGIFLVELLHREKRVVTYGFYDSGNRLKDPYTGKGVHIISEQLLKRLELNRDNVVLVPYQALGSESGMVEVYYVDELVLEGEKQKKSWKKCPLGVTKENLFKESKYEMILNEEVF